MILVPFDPRATDQIMQYYFDPIYSHFARGQRKYLNVDEVSRLPQYLDNEVLMVLEDDKVIGLITIDDKVAGVVCGGFVLHKDYLRKGLAPTLWNLFEDYAFNKKRARIITFEIISKDTWLGAFLEKFGCTKVLELENYFELEGKLEAISFYIKRRPTNG